jgi:hypothetical protein
MDGIEKELATAIKRAARSQKTALDSVQGLLAAVTTAQAASAAGDASAITALKERVRKLDALSAVKDDHKLLHAALSKLGKAVDTAVAGTGAGAGTGSGGSAGAGDASQLCPPDAFECEYYGAYH